MAELLKNIDLDLECVNIVNNKHQELLNKKKSILERLSGRAKKRQIIRINIDKSNPANWAMYIRDKNDNIIGFMILHQNLRRLLIPKVELNKKREPVFRIYKDEVLCFAQDIMKNKACGINIKKDEFNDVVKTYRDSQPIIDITKKIFELIETRQYGLVEEFIRTAMENLIKNNIDAASIEQRQIYTELYVASQRINKIKLSINELQQTNGDCQPLLENLDQEYRDACQKILNSKLDELVNSNTFNH